MERKKSKNEIRRKLKEIIENKDIQEVDYCDVGIYHLRYKHQLSRNSLIVLSSYLDKKFEVRLYVWNPEITQRTSLKDQNIVEKLNKMADAYKEHIIPMTENEINMFFMPYIGYSLCSDNLIKKLRMRKPKAKSKQNEKESNKQTKILVLRKIFNSAGSLRYDHILFYNSDNPKSNYMKSIFFIIYWIVETCRRRGFHFNFKNYDSIEIKKIPKTAFLFVLSKEEIIYVVTEYIPIFNLYYCNLNEEFDIDFFECYTEKMIKEIEYHDYSEFEMMDMEITSKKVIMEIKIEKEEKREKISAYERMKKLVQTTLDQKSRIIYKLSNYGIESLKKQQYRNLYSENILFIDEETRSKFYSEFTIQNSLADFVIKTFYSEFYTLSTERTGLFKFINFRNEEKLLRSSANWIIASIPDITNQGKYIFDFKNENLLSDGIYYSIWINCKDEEVEKFDRNCKYMAKITSFSHKLIEKFEREYHIAKEAAKHNIGAKVIDHYYIRNSIEAKYPKILMDDSDYLLGVIIMERWSMTLLNYKNNNKNEYDKQRKKIKEKWVELYWNLYNKLGYVIIELNFENVMIRFENNEIILAIINFEKAMKPTKTYTKKDFENYYNNIDSSRLWYSFIY